MNINQLMLKSFLVICSLFLLVSLKAQTLKEIADTKGVYIGAIMNNEFVNNTNDDAGKPNQIIRDEFNVLVLENAMKMSNVLNSRPANPFSFGSEALNKNGIDKFLDYCKDDVPSEKIRTRGHTMIWYNAVPNWLKTESENWSKQQVYDFSYQYIKALGSYCGNRIDEWDVVNEALHDGSGLGPFRSEAWYNNVGSTQAELDDYFVFCFETAREFAPNAKLFYNDYNIEQFNGGSNSKNARMRSFVERLQAKDAPIDAVGFQCHFVLTQMANGSNANTSFMNSVETSMEYLADINLDVAITELDIRRCGGSGTDAGHKAAYNAFTSMALSQPNCNTLLVWGISDKDSWVIPFFSCDYAVLFDDNYEKKSAYFGVQGAISSLNEIGDFANEITNATTPLQITQGEEITLSVTYESNEENDLVVMLQLDEDPYTVFQEKRIRVFKEKITQNIEMLVSFDVPVGNEDYQFQFYLAPVAGGWDDKLSDFNKNNISVLEGVPVIRGPFDDVIQIPGTIELENYDIGGQGVSYNDIDPENNGGASSNFRVNEGVDIGGSNGSYSLAWTATGEWLEYSVNIEKDAIYEFEFRTAAATSGGLLGIDLDGSSVLSGVVVPQTSDWNTYVTFKETVTLSQGEQVLRFNIENAAFNIDKIIIAEKPAFSVNGKFTKNDVSVFPNPSNSGVFFFSKETEFIIYSLTGEVLLSGKGKELDLSGQTKGVFLLNIGGETVKLMR